MTKYKMSYLYTDAPQLYQSTIASDGATLQYIDPTEGPQTIPSITGNANEFLRVNATADNIEWTDIGTTGSVPINEVALGDGQFTDPSLTFQSDQSSGLCLLGVNQIGVATNNVQRLEISNTAFNVGTATDKLLMTLNGQLSYSTSTIPPGTYTWNTDFSTDSIYILSTASGDININLSATGSVGLHQAIRFYKNSTGFTVKLFASGGTVRLNGAFGTQSRTSGAQFTLVPDGTGNLWLFEIIRTGATLYTLNILDYNNVSTAATTFQDQVIANTFFAGDGSNTNASYSFRTSGGLDTGLYYSFDTQDRLRVAAGGSFVQEFNSVQMFTNVRTLANLGTGSNTTPAIIFHNDSSTTGYAGQRTNPSTDPRLWAIVNGVQATELTQTQFNVGLTTSNNTNLKTLNQNGSSNFNTYQISYSSIVAPQTNTGLGLGAGAYRSIIFDGTNYVAVNSTTTAGNTRLAYTTSLTTPTTWSTITNTGLNMNNCGSIAFGAGIYVVIGTTASSTRQCFTSTNLTTWTQVPNTAPWTTSVTLTRVRFINNQFLVLMNGSQVFYSSDGITWANRTINGTAYVLNDVVYSPELQMYVFATGSTAVLHFAGTSIGPTTTATAVTSGVQAANTITYSPKLGMFLAPNNAVNTNVIWSKNGTTWNNTTVTATPNALINSNEIIWVNDFGGMFVNAQFNNSNIAVSRDGFNWQVFTYGVTMNSVSLCYNAVNKVLLIGGSATTAMTFRNMLTDFNAFVDLDTVYNTFNSNTRFSDVIEYQSQLITTTSTNNHFTISEFNRSVISFDTSGGNSNIYLQGSSYNGRVGIRFKIRKFHSSSNGVRIHGYESCEIQTPFGRVASFNAQSTPFIYDIIPNTYFGSFELSRVSDNGTGIWVVDNVIIYDSNGVEYKLDDLRVGNNLLTDGKVSVQNVGSMSATSPAIYFGSDTDTGFYSGAANTLNFTSGGLERLVIGNNITIGNVSNSANFDLWGRETIRQIRVDTMTAKTADFSTSNTESSAITIDASTAVVTMTLDGSMPTGTILYIHKLDSANALRITNVAGDVFNGLNRTNFVWQTARGMGILRKFNSTSWQGVYILE
jgi:hypothetical protein